MSEKYRPPSGPFLGDFKVPPMPTEEEWRTFHEQRAIDEAYGNSQELHDEHVLREHRPKITLDREEIYAAFGAVLGSSAGSLLGRNPELEKRLTDGLTGGLMKMTDLLPAVLELLKPQGVREPEVRIKKRPKPERNAALRKQRDIRRNKKKAAQHANGSPQHGNLERPDGP